MTAILTFNTAAAQMINGRGRARVEFKDDTLRIRPTDRKAGPHVLADFTPKGKGFNVQIDEKQLEKLNAGKAMAEGATFHVVSSKYGWLTLASGDAPADSPNADAKVTVHIKEEAAA